MNTKTSRINRGLAVLISVALILVLFPTVALANHVTFRSNADCYGFWFSAQNWDYDHDRLVFQWQVDLLQNGTVVETYSGQSDPIAVGITYEVEGTWQDYPSTEGYSVHIYVQGYTETGDPTTFILDTTTPLSNCLASLGDRTWYDANYDGIQSADTSAEPGVEGVTVELYECGATTPLNSTSTDQDGYYLFDNLAPGDYYVKFIKPASFSIFTRQDQGTDDTVDSDADPTNGETVCVTLAGGDEDLTWDAGFYGSTPSAVGLTSFEATAGNQAITLHWETASELDNLGFNLYRAESADGPWTRLNADLIPSQVPPGSPVGAAYSFEDGDVWGGTVYYYRLETIDVQGYSGFYGPVDSALKAMKLNPLRPRLRLD